ncbi:protein disulfide oxidoreductase [Aliivibrio logei]|jgi:thiol-disulfide isomerase/thioredoxin|uniref:protein disulfide oxidoreductase n=1 Tax=Aliivibrio logei TaxID=688 RepID=UPI0035C87F04
MLLKSPNNQTKKNKNSKADIVKFVKEITKFAFFIILLVSAIDFWRSKDMPSELIPPLSINTIDDDWVDIEKMSHEKPVLLYFWGTWCPICNIVSPSISWLASDHQVVSVAITSGDNKRLSQFMNYKEYDFPVVNDSTGNISKEWGVTATPSIVIINNGKVSSITTGATTPIGLWLRLFFA